MVPGQAKTIFVISVHTLSLQPQFQELQLQELPSCVRMDREISERHMCTLGHEYEVIHDKTCFVFLKPRVEALSSLEPLMNEDQKHSVFTTLIFPFLSRVDLPGT